MRLVSKLFLILFMTLFPVGIAYSATLYMATTGTNSGNCQSAACLTLEYSVSQMSGGDTLTIADGTYSGSTNCLDASHLPPSGSAGSPTIIRATNDGGAVFPNSFIDMLGSGTAASYIDFIGLKVTSNQTNILGLNHIRFFRCSFAHEPADGNNDPVLGIGEGNTYILVEDCWAYGGGRYKFLAYGGYGAEPTTTDIVFRRCIVRFDRAHPTQPIAGFSIYHVDRVSMQNCIVIDGDHDEFWLDTEERGGAFYVHHGSNDVVVTGSIVLNHKSYAFGGAPEGLTVSNSVAWAVARALSSNYAFNASGITSGHFRATTSGWHDISAQGAYFGTSTATLTNGIYYDSDGVALGGNISSDYNVLYLNTTNYSGSSAGTHDYASQNSNAIDPIDGTPGNGTACLKYLPRIEVGSDCDGTGSGSADRGANILYKIGTSGTFYGDSGYNTVTTESLWPWPNEARIKTDMAAYSYTGAIYPSGTDTLSGARGFCTGTSIDGSSQTLTKYIWEYLGNQIPSEIYGVPAGDTTPPSVSISTSDPSSITADSLSVTGTASDAVWGDGSVCKWRIGSAPDASNGTTISGLTYSGTVNWSFTASGFSRGSNTLYVGCRDAVPNWGSKSMIVNYNPSSQGISGVSGLTVW